MSEEKKSTEGAKPAKSAKGSRGRRIALSAWFKALKDKLVELRGEFRKIVWPPREVLVKHTVTTIVISLLFGAFIALLDGAFGVIFTTLTGLLG